LPALFDGLFEQGIAVHTRPLKGTVVPALWSEEQAAVTDAVPRRIHEFAAGRACAREAMAALGLPLQAVPRRSDRAPAWPSGVVGSISHSPDICAAALGRSESFVAIGLDIEPWQPLDVDLLDEICVPAEQEWLRLQPADQRLLLAKAIFSAKECAYKCQYPLSGRLYGFSGMSVALDPANGRFSARFDLDAAPFTIGDVLHGRLRVAEGHVATGIALRTA
jgi:4'-phosphopantetheinyl transferase EntD